MDQKKTGRFLRELRTERGLTQEQLAEKAGVSNRSVSRWENGVNLPDFDLLMELAEYFGVGVEELLDGERKPESREEKSGEALLKVADYSSQGNLAFSRRIHYVFLADVAALLVYMVLEMQGLAAEGPWSGPAGFLLGLVLGTLLMGALYTSRYMSRIRAFKLRLLHREK
ncbi:MAG: helix-turn-helix domain-containing protein [Oscillospiraceae bacterium]